MSRGKKESMEQNLTEGDHIDMSPPGGKADGGDGAEDRNQYGRAKSKSTSERGK